jgi:hypothetical protein
LDEERLPPSAYVPDVLKFSLQVLGLQPIAGWLLEEAAAAAAGPLRSTPYIYCCSFPALQVWSIQPSAGWRVKKPAASAAAAAAAASGQCF